MCYRVETLRYDRAMFENSVDVAYVLTMENSSRRSQYLKQLDTFRPCRTVHIQHNKGYKACEKPLCHDEPCYDLAHAFYTAMRHAPLEGKVMFLEDDFMFLDEVTTEDVARIEDFDRPYDVYNLGPFAIASVPVNAFHVRLLKWTCAHALILSAGCREAYLTQFEANACRIRHIDVYLGKFICYAYHRPLAIQRFEATENSAASWGTKTGIRPVDRFTNRSLFAFTRWLRLDTDPERGFHLTSITSVMLVPMILMVLVVFSAR